VYFPQYSKFYIRVTQEIAKLILDTGLHVSPYGLDFRQGWNKYVANLGIKFVSHHDRNLFWLHVCTSIILQSDKSQAILINKVQELMLTDTEKTKFKRSTELSLCSFDELTTMIESLSTLLFVVGKKAEEAGVDHPYWYNEWSRLVDSAIIARAKKEMELKDG
jgi:hypothetical protein